MTTHHTKALFTTTGFALVGVASWVFLVTDWYVSLPLAIFYAVLTVNTFPSVHLFASVVPDEDRRHFATDILLGFLYVLLAITFIDPISFALATTLLFIVASGKYAMLLNTIPHDALLKRKIIIDAFGALLSASVLGVMLAGFVFSASWALAGIFLAANVYLLWVRPMYRLD